jgi:hypothetical protein
MAKTIDHDRAEAAFQRLAGEHYEKFPACPGCGRRHAVTEFVEGPELDRPGWRCGSCGGAGEGRLERAGR